MYDQSALMSFRIEIVKCHCIDAFVVEVSGFVQSVFLGLTKTAAARAASRVRIRFMVLNVDMMFKVRILFLL